MAKECYRAYAEHGAFLKGTKIFVFYTGKNEIVKPDKRPGKFTSVYLMLIIYTSNFITSDLVYKILGAFGTVLKVFRENCNFSSYYFSLDQSFQCSSALCLCQNGGPGFCYYCSKDTE